MVEVGTGVTRRQVGDRVTVPFVCGCGRCEWCRGGQRAGLPRPAAARLHHWGSFAEHVALHAADTNLVALPDEIDFATAASLGCRFATAFRALVGRARVAEGEWVTVIGAGGVGLSAVMIARALGARVVAVDRNPEALAVAGDLGADTPCSPPGPTSRPRSHDLTDGGSHVAVDAVGSEQTCADALLSLRRRGRRAQVGLLPPVGATRGCPWTRVIAWELDLLGSHGMAAADYPPMMELIRSGALQPQRLVERTIGLEEARRCCPASTARPRRIHDHRPCR